MDRRDFVAQVGALPIFAPLLKLLEKSETPLGEELITAMRPLTQAALAGATMVALRLAYEEEGLDVLKMLDGTISPFKKSEVGLYWSGENAPISDLDDSHFKEKSKTEQVIEKVLLNLFGSENDAEVDRIARSVVDLIRKESDVLSAKIGAKALKELGE